MGKTVRKNVAWPRSVSYKSPHSHFSRGGCAERDRSGHKARRQRTTTSLTLHPDEPDTAMFYRDRSSRLVRRYEKGMGSGNQTQLLVAALRLTGSDFASSRHNRFPGLVADKQLKRRGRIGKFTGWR